jgi:hypothetical protein
MLGSDAAIMLRGNKAWLFKEADSPLLGWEVYARKEQFFDETGIALVANATKSTKTDQSKGQNEAAYTDPPLYFAMESFLANTELIADSVENFVSTFGANDTKALKEYLAGIQKNKLPAATHRDGYEAAVLAIKANEAMRRRHGEIRRWFGLILAANRVTGSDERNSASARRLHMTRLKAHL